MADSISPGRARRLCDQGELRLFDLRRKHERLTGMPVGAEAVAPEDLEQVLARHDHRPVALICESGQRSIRCCDQWRDRTPVTLINVEGGVAAWRAAGLPLALPDSPLSARERQRYLRHLALPDVGEAGQLKLRRARVLLVGAGGLGSPTALYLAAAGIGHLGLIDDDVVERSNLQRQVLHDETGLGRPKVESAHARLGALNPDIRIEIHRRRLDDDNVDSLVGAHDIVVDGSDNFPTRYRVNRACARHRRPLVYGAVEQFSGQVGIFAAGDGVQPCYRCLFPSAPAPEDAPNCAEAGVLGVLPGLIGMLQATEVIKLCLELGEPLIGRVLMVDALGMRFRTFRVERDPECPDCAAVES
ncbi:MAG: molybdopterin-synthase adenylyltransferase MoeB [Wenzhouxiangellaceae bacterium]